MASEFPPPPGSGDVEPPAKASELSQAPAEPHKEVSLKSVFVDSTPIREDQVQNAIKFLSHPRVQGSPVVHRRNFLMRKELTKEEIDEAFRRVPLLKDPSPGFTGAQKTTSSQVNQLLHFPLFWSGWADDAFAKHSTAELCTAHRCFFSGFINFPWVIWLL